MAGQTFRLNVDLSDVPPADRADVLDEVADALVEGALDMIGEGRSPVYGTKWKGLSKIYKRRKLEEGGKPIANLELSGDLLDALEAKVRRVGPIGVVEYGIFDQDQVDKADGHNNLSGNSSLPLRRFVPGPGEGFADRIQSRVDQIVADAEEV